MNSCWTNMGLSDFIPDHQDGIITHMWFGNCCCPFLLVEKNCLHLWECHQLSYLLMVGETSESIFIGLVYSGHSGRPVQLCEFLLGFFGPARDIHLASWYQPRWGFRYYHYPHHSMECRWFLGAATRNLGGWFFITHGMWGSQGKLGFYTPWFSSEQVKKWPNNNTKSVKWW